MTAPISLIGDEPFETLIYCPACECQTLHHEFAVPPTDTDAVTYRAFQCQEH